MGMLIAVVGMTSVEFIVANKDTLVGLGSLENYEIWLSFGGLILVASLIHHGIIGSILIAIVALTVITWAIENSFPKQIVTVPAFNSHSFSYLDFTDFDFSKCVTGVISFLFIGLIDVSGVIYGMGCLAGISEKNEETGEVIIPGTTESFVAVSLATLVGASMGGSPIIVYVESAAGIKEGGKTGLTGVVTGLLFLLALFFAPILSSIPETATAPIAVLIGVLMMSQVMEIHWEDMREAVPAFLTLLVMPLTLSITDGIAAGLLASLALYITTGDIWRDVKASRKSNYLSRYARAFLAVPQDEAPVPADTVSKQPESKHNVIAETTEL
jgi:AGZA family xanthine/uracil permease-like MFS transporter